MNNVRKMTLPRACIAVFVAAYHHRSKGPRRVANTKGRWSAQLQDTCTRGNALDRARPRQDVDWMVLSEDETAHGSKTSAYRSAHIIQQPVHGLATNAHLERVLRDA